MSLQETDQAAAAVATHPRVKLEDIESKIAAKVFGRGSALLGTGEPPETTDGALDLLTICVLVTRNGFSVVGKSAPASPENFNAELGQKLAYEDAVRQLWPLEGYLLRERLSEQEQTPPSEQEQQTDTTE